ncbi:MAG: MoaD/ThiS family protein [Candidatus Bathyarchaeia archaeon]
MVKVLGSLVEEAGFKERDFNLKDDLTLTELLSMVFQRRGESGLSYSHMLILVNGVEAAALPQGLETKLGKNDEVTMIPVSHGG